MPPRNHRTAEKDWAPDFLDALEEHVTVSAACKAIGIGRRTAYDRRQRDEEFALAWHDVEEATTQRMEREAFRRAVEGTEKPVYQGKELVGTVREFSDTLLIFMLKSRRPEKYRDNMRVEHAGKVGVDVSSSSDEELRRIAEGILARRDDTGM